MAQQRSITTFFQTQLPRKRTTTEAQAEDSGHEDVGDTAEPESQVKTSRLSSAATGNPSNSEEDDTTTSSAHLKDALSETATHCHSSNLHA